MWYKILETIMKTILYVHGFASAGSTGTATMMRNILHRESTSASGEYQWQQRQDVPEQVQVISPDVPVMPTQALAFLRQTVQELQPHLIVATSMGAMYAEQLRGVPRILVNPSFQMARLLTFRGMGRHEFRNRREDGARDFKIDREMINQFRAVEKDSFVGITPQEKQLVWGLFGANDKNVNCQPDFLKHYGREHFRIFDGEHYLNDTVLKHAVMPLVHDILGL